MVARKYKAWWALPFSTLLTLNAVAAETIALKLDNYLAACITINQPTMYSADGILFAKIAYVQKDLTAGCGCKSALSYFTAYGGKKERHKFLMDGNFVFREAGTMNLPLTMNPLLVVEKSIILTISCAAPE
jgi:hypothetical protein